MAETIGNLIDKLTIVNIRIWNAEDMKRDAMEETDPATKSSQILKATEITNLANKQRNDLIQEIDEKINELVTSGAPQKLYKQGSSKLYGKNSL